MATADTTQASRKDVFAVALRLGLTSFGGPVAHLGYFRHEYVERRGWLSEGAYADLVALCQVLPGPASSQLGIAIGTFRSGRIGGFLAWLGFTLPSAVAMIAIALLASAQDLSNAGWVHGLKIAAVSVVAAAVVAMWRSLAPDAPRSVMALGAAAVSLVLPSPFTQVAIIVIGAAIGWRLLSASEPRVPDVAETSMFGRRFAVALYTPVWTGGIERPADALVAAAGLGLLLSGRVQPLVVVVMSAAAGEALSRIA